MNEEEAVITTEGDAKVIDEHTQILNAEEEEEDDDAKKTPDARLADARAKVSALFGKKEG